MKHLLATFALVLVVASASLVAEQQSVHVTGEVSSPGAYAWQSDMTVQVALDAAGGPTEKFSLARSHIIRASKNKDGDPITVKIAKLKEGTLLLPGDTLVAGKRWE